MTADCAEGKRHVRTGQETRLRCESNDDDWITAEEDDGGSVTFLSVFPDNVQIIIQAQDLCLQVPSHSGDSWM